MFAFFFAPGIQPCASDLLNNSVIVLCYNFSEHSFSTLGDISSGPVDLFGSIFRKYLRTSCACISFMESHSSSDH